MLPFPSKQEKLISILFSFLKGKTALYWATKKGHEAVAKVLREHGAGR